MKIAELNLLIVEDDGFQCKILTKMLRTLGATSIRDASNGKDALEIIRRTDYRPVDIAICDLNMPEMDGMEFLRHLSQENKNIAIIITSALDNKLLSSVGKMATMFGIDLLGTMEKPIMLKELQALLFKYDHAKHEKPQPDTKMVFTLDEVLHGIRADQIQPFFQPKVALRSGLLVGAEALARWLHPEHGVIGPYAFIPLLESSRNIDELTFLMLEKSAAACRSFHDRGHILTISVNLSLATLDDPALADKITQVVQKAGIEPQYIILEITESSAMTGIAHALENLARLCMNGFALSIDDYGTGYSSLQQLTRIAFSELKIDQSFVKDFADNKASRIVVESSIDMAHKLHVKSVAEGTETQQDWDALRDAGCDTAQGYFIARPMDMNAFHHFMESSSYKTSALSQPSIQDQNKVNILVVDDNDFTRKIVLRVLDSLGYTRISAVPSAASALKLLELNTFNLIITDVHLPGLNGLELAQLIRAGKTHTRPDTRIVILTSFSQTEVFGTALALDINGFLVKPIIPAMANEKLAQAISEPLHLRPPLAYETIKTELWNLPRPGNQPGSHGSAGIVHSLDSEADNTLRHTIRSLRPGMKLKEDIYLSDGTLLISSEHVFTELSINRLNDLKELLSRQSIFVHDTAAPG
ncbi:MAG: EAL domain-containing protein [Nitrosomonadales bacterium]|nr:EAL domain-containing protein [Nitrosomonadales bacterium]